MSLPLSPAVLVAEVGCLDAVVLYPRDDAVCHFVGDGVANEVTHRVITWIEEGTVQTAHFCDEDCRMNWDTE